MKGTACWLWISPNGHVGDCYPPKVDWAFVAAVAACITVAALVGFALHRCKYHVPSAWVTET